MLARTAGPRGTCRIAAALKLGGNESYPGSPPAAADRGRPGQLVGLTDTPGIGFESKAAFTRPARRRLTSPHRDTVAGIRTVDPAKGGEAVGCAGR